LEQGISKLSLDKGNKLKEGHGNLLRERIFLMYVKKKKGGRSGRNFFSFYVWGGVHGKGVCKNQAWKEVVCSKYL